MNYTLKKISTYLFFALVLVFSFSFTASVAHAACETTSDNGTQTYCLLAPIPGLTSSTDGSLDVTNGFGDYATGMIRIFIGLLGVLAVVMIVFGGIQYMLASSGGEKGAGKERITNAIFGLILALSSYMILNTINPNLVNIKVAIPNGSLDSHNFDKTQPGQDGLGVGGDVKTGVGNKVKNSAGDEITAGISKTVTFYVGTKWTGGGLDYSWTSNNGICSHTDDPHADTSCVFVANGKAMSDLLVHNSLEADVKAVFADWRALKNQNLDGKHPYQISWILGFNGTLAPGTNVIQSAHTFGIAIDVLPEPVDPALVAIFKKHGFGWGGDLSSKDYKHFSKLQEEQGSGSNSYFRE
jgi:hypothetical protein